MSLFLDDGDVRLFCGDALEVLGGMEDGSVDCVITSPPYWGLRDYGAEGQLGLEATPDEYVTSMVAVFREVRRVLSGSGTCWVNMGDSYANTGVGSFNGGGFKDKSAETGGRDFSGVVTSGQMDKFRASGLKQKDLCGIPWMLAFALRDDGWYLRSDIVWSKPNPMPESVTDRPTKSHEYVFLLSKRPRYFFDQEAAREPYHPDGRQKTWISGASQTAHENYANREGHDRWPGTGRNIRSVWEIATQPYPEAHFATYPEELVRRCLLAGCPEQVCGECGKPRERIVEVESRPNVSDNNGKHDGTLYRTVSGGVSNDGRARRELGFTDCGHNNYRPGIVLDLFAGSGTTALVARKHGRHAVLIELNEAYCKLAADRLSQLSLLSGLGA